MQFDPNNPVVKLCAEGMNAEFEGDIEKANHIFQQAWETSTNDFESFTAAHYVARNQTDPAISLQWNMKALDHARAIADDDMKLHFPSLYLNVAKSCEDVGDMAEAAKYYRSASASADQLPDTKYGQMIRSGISAGLKRVGAAPEINSRLAALIDVWCERKDLKPLSMILPAWVGNMGTEIDNEKLISALYFLSATKSLSSDEQKIVDEVIVELRSKNK